MQPTLPSFEGQPVRGATMKLTGKSDEQIGALAHDETVYLVVRAVVSKVSHGDVTVGELSVFTREHTVKADRVVLITAEDGERMLDEAIMLADDRFGIQSIFGQDSTVDTETGEIAD